MKKLRILTVLMVLMTSLFIITGCDNGNKNEGNIKKAKLVYDFSHMNKKIYSASFKISRDDKTKELYEDEENSILIENEKNNYALELTLESEAREGYKHQIDYEKDENEIFEEKKFGKYEGFYSKSSDGIYGRILLDESDETFNIYVLYTVYPLDENADKNDAKELFESSQVQNILNNIVFKTN